MSESIGRFGLNVMISTIEPPPSGRMTGQHEENRMNPIETSFYVESGHKQYGPFRTTDDAVTYASQLGVGRCAISEHRGRLVSSREITPEEFERLGVEGIPQLDGSILFPVETR
jgi:hypothetical protein